MMIGDDEKRPEREDRAQPEKEQLQPSLDYTQFYQVQKAIEVADLWKQESGKEPVRHITIIW